MTLIPFARPVERIKSWRLHKAHENVAVERADRGGKIALDAEIAELADAAADELAYIMGQRQVRSDQRFAELGADQAPDTLMRLALIQNRALAARLEIHETFARRAGRA